MNFKKIFFLGMFIISLTIAANAEFVNLWRPFSNCYTQDFNLCGQNNCNTETVDSKTIPFTYNGISCNIQVFYRIRTCYCPEPVTFIDLDYIKVSLTDCPELVCLLHPGQSEPPPNGCINNPLDEDIYKRLEATMYRDLCRLLFEDIKSQYPCPNKMTFRKYTPGSCEKMCIARLEATGESPAVIYMPKSCDQEYCCYDEYQICLNQYDELVEERYVSSSSITCTNGPNGNLEGCLQVNDTVNILGTVYTVTMTAVSICYGTCYPWEPFY